MYTSVHLNVSHESYSFELFDLLLDLKLQLLVEDCLFIIKDKTFDCGNQNIH